MRQPADEPCCYAGEYGRLFGRRGAERDVRHYERRGLGRSARDLVGGLTSRGVGGMTVLEVGGGAGTIQVELLAAGAGSVVNVDLSPHWEQAAARLLSEHGLRDRVERRVGDFVAIADEVGEADVVVLHRVVCCYPDWRRLLGLAIGRAGHAIALTFPRNTVSTRLAIGGENLLRRLRRQDFRAFVHPPSQMLQLLAGAGFEVTSDTSTLAWRTVVLHRTSG